MSEEGIGTGQRQAKSILEQEAEKKVKTSGKGTELESQGHFYWPISWEMP